MSAVPRSCFLFLVMLLVLIGVPKANAADPAPTDQKSNLIEEEALEIFTRSTDYLAKLKQFQCDRRIRLRCLARDGSEDRVRLPSGRHDSTPESFSGRFCPAGWD